MNREQYDLLLANLPKPSRIHVGEFWRGEYLKDGLLLLGVGPQNEEVRFEVRNYIVVQVIQTEDGEKLIDTFPVDLRIARPATVFFPEHCDGAFVHYLLHRGVHVPFREFRDITQ